MNNIKKTNNKSTTTHKPQVDLIEIQICEYNRPTGLKKLSSAPCLNSMFIIYHHMGSSSQMGSTKRPTIIEGVFTQVINLMLLYIGFYCRSLKAHKPFCLEWLLHFARQLVDAPLESIFLPSLCVGCAGHVGSVILDPV